jgi:hypothetical protein
MSTTKPNDASLLARLDDALMDNIFELSEADLDAEIKELGLDPAAEVASMRSAIDKAVKAAAKATLLSAKAELAKFKLEKSGGAHDAAAGRALLERITTAPAPAMAEMMMAARKGKALSESDEEGVAEDLADLEKLGKKPE